MIFIVTSLILYPVLTEPIVQRPLSICPAGPEGRFESYLRRIYNKIKDINACSS